MFVPHACLRSSIMSAPQKQTNSKRAGFPCMDYGIIPCGLCIPTSGPASRLFYRPAFYIARFYSRKNY